MTILPLCPLPNLAWMAAYLSSNEVVIDTGEHYIKQSFRNRLELAGHQGRQNLSFPVRIPSGVKLPLWEVELDEELHWKKINWRSIVSACSSSPYFIYYKDSLEEVFFKEHQFLGSLSDDLLKWLFNKLQIVDTPKIDREYIANSELHNDYRGRFKGQIEWELEFEEYPQVFEERSGFLPNLSTLDLLINLGPEANSHLKLTAERLRP